MQSRSQRYVDSDDNDALGVESVCLTLPMLISKLWLSFGMSAMLAGTRILRESFKLPSGAWTIARCKVAVFVTAANLPHACQGMYAYDSRLLLTKFNRVP